MSTQPWMLPSPRRSEVAKGNRAKRHGITEEGRQRLRKAAVANKPWERSTGPKSLWGKYLSARNGKVRQKGEFSVREARAEVRANRELIRFILEHPELGILEAR